MNTPVDPKPQPGFKKMMVVINPNAGIDRPILGLLNKQLNAAGIEWEVALTHKAGDAHRLAKQAAQDGYDVVAAHGGDGTVMEVADGLRGTNVPLAIFPGGTANAMASELGVPYDLGDAISVVTSGHYAIHTVDMAATPQSTFLLRIGIGLEADMTKNADQEIKNRFGILAYAVSALNEIRTLTPAHYAITIDGQQVEAEGISCMIANSGNVSIGGLTLSKKIDITDGQLDVVVFTNANLATLANLTRAVIRGEDSTEYDEVLHWQGSEIRIDSNPPQSISVDGEQVEPGTIEARVLPGAVRLIVPTSAPPAK